MSGWYSFESTTPRQLSGCHPFEEITLRQLSGCNLLKKVTSKHSYEHYSFEETASKQLQGRSFFEQVFIKQMFAQESQVYMRIIITIARTFEIPASGNMSRVVTIVSPEQSL
jgi:hypothetical protein